MNPSEPTPPANSAEMLASLRAKADASGSTLPKFVLVDFETLESLVKEGGATRDALRFQWSAEIDQIAEKIDFLQLEHSLHHEFLRLHGLARAFADFLDAKIGDQEGGAS